MILSPSLFNSDLYLIKETLDTLDLLGITHLHIDVMDNHYVPNLGFNIGFISNLKAHTNFILDCHLMVEKPELSILDFIEAKPDIITFHYEATVHHSFIINKIKSNNIKVGLAINPSTPVESIKMLLPFVDLVLVMTVNPGQKNEVFLPFTLQKIEQLNLERQKGNYHYDIQVDGNITDKTLPACVAVGANNIVSGGFIFKNNEIGNNIEKLKVAIS
ncbi:MULTISPECIES: ribulose-phosphate 3-epimerase [unclassified Gilliamella]|uniref:ribulose-phosphate 3-epimerase n=1 Tax=unclassified Gilliamella TaxID=2685620 RepID=UPI0013293B46|nr:MULTISPECIES: ribulose-phosphate 3-epimerase [unclassified Gilliamella]MWN30927.1 ribulose-phosphate 3-epimerase [Gilliamella sp. Pra-s60]MWP28508.1 ribulose-phosphate 3-epimerase [Gilliamella sp. Pra-s54]